MRIADEWWVVEEEMKVEVKRNFDIIKLVNFNIHLQSDFFMININENKRYNNKYNKSQIRQYNSMHIPIRHITFKSWKSNNNKDKLIR